MTFRLDHALRFTPPPKGEKYSDRQVRKLVKTLEELGQIADRTHFDLTVYDAFQEMRRVLADVGMAHGADWRPPPPPAPPKPWPHKPLVNDLARQRRIQRGFTKKKRR
jgi:hypothetical protein